MESWLLAQQAEMFAVYAEIQAMIAENQLREINQESPAFGYEHFREKAEYLFSIRDMIYKNR